MNKFLKLGILVAFLFFLFSVLFKILLGPAGGVAEEQIFTVPQNQLGFNAVGALAEQKLIKNKGFTNFVFFVVGRGKVESGGFKLTKNMNTLQILRKISGKPDLVWVTIAFCQRKEQIGERLAGSLGWSPEKLAKWNNLYKTENTDYFEGVYYPDTY